MTAPANDTDTGNGGAIPAVRAQVNEAAEMAREKAARAVEAAKDGLGQAKETLVAVLETSRDKASDVYATGRDTAVDVLASSRERASEAYTAARERAKAVGGTAAGRVEASPLVALIGGIAAGVVIGALLPRTERETQALGGVSQKLNELAKEAIEAARGAGEAKLADLGLTPDKARASLHTLLDGAMAAANSASTAVSEAKPAKQGGGDATTRS